jgi:hypothetical protein
MLARGGRQRATDGAIGAEFKGGTMRCSILKSIALCLGILVCVAAGAADKKAKEGQITGRVQMIDKDKSTITVAKGTTQRQVIYNSDTKWMHGTQASNKPSSLDELKENWYINCEGKFDGVKLVANACRFRASK